MKRFVIAGLFLLATVPAFSQEPADTVFAPPSPYLFRDGQKIKVWKAETKRNERTRNDADFSQSGQRYVSDTTYTLGVLSISTYPTK